MFVQRSRIAGTKTAVYSLSSADDDGSKGPSCNKACPDVSVRGVVQAFAVSCLLPTCTPCENLLLAHADLCGNGISGYPYVGFRGTGGFIARFAVSPFSKTR